MPELPEVELVTKSLNKLVRSRKIQTAELLRERLVPETPPKEFAEILNGQSIDRVHRRGKHILFDFDNDQTLIVHLRMSGRFLLLPIDRENPKFTHAIFYFEDETRLVFSDQRHFGFMKLVETSQINKAREIKKLAPEPFSDEFSKEYFREILKTSSRNLKEFILDQTKVCGLGNIYAAEALFLAKINPTIPAKEVSAIKANRLHKFIREVLQESIKHGSTLNVNPENIDGSYYGGGYEDHWRVYDREGEPCSNCDTRIKRLKQGGRSSYFCPKCQRAK
jgi:formamidopyrimidine-DNA glycosylase